MRSRPRPQPTVVVVDDDPVTSNVVAALVESRGATVLAEGATSRAAIDLVEQFSPDVLVLDLSLAAGTGLEVIGHLRAHGSPCQVVVFTAYADTGHALDGPGVRVVEKPAFDRLEVAIDAAFADGRTGPAVERRRPGRAAGRPGARTDGRDDPAAFYEALAGAQPGDALVGIPADGHDTVELERAVRGVVRDVDLIAVRRDLVVALLVDGGPAGAQGVLARLASIDPVVADRSRVCVVGAGFDPVAALESLAPTGPGVQALLLAG